MKKLEIICYHGKIWNVTGEPNAKVIIKINNELTFKTLSRIKGTCQFSTNINDDVSVAYADEIQFPSINPMHIK